MVLKRCTISLLSRHLGLEESKITGHSNKREKIARLSKRVPKGFKLKTRITIAWSQEKIDLCSQWAEVDAKPSAFWVFGRGRNYRVLKPGRPWEHRGTWFGSGRNYRILKLISRLTRSRSGFGRRWNYMVLKRVCGRADNVLWFRRR